MKRRAKTRRSNRARVEITRSWTFGHQYRHAETECRKYDVDERLLERALVQGQLPAIRGLSRLLTNRIRSRRATGQQTRLNKAIPPALCSFCATVMVDNCYRIGEPPPRELCDLLIIHLKTTAYGRKETRHADVWLRAVAYQVNHPNANYIELARYAGVSKVAALQWQKDPVFIRWVDGLKRQQPAVREFFGGMAAALPLTLPPHFERDTL